MKKDVNNTAAFLIHFVFIRIQNEIPNYKTNPGFITY
jgi:hypothetical protein